MGNAAMGFMVIFAMIAGVVGAGPCLSGIHHIMSWKHESLVVASGEGIPLSNLLWAVYFPMGNVAMGFMVIFAMIAGVVGAGSCLSGIHHIMSWKHESLAAASGEGIPLPNLFWAVYFPMGNAAMGFMVIFAMIAGVVGAGSCLSGIHHIMSWKHESLAATSGEGIPLPNPFWAVYFPMGNAAMGFMVIFAMIAGVVGAGSCLSGIHHIMSWKHESLAAASGEGIPLPNPFWAVYFPMGNVAMGFMVIFVMIAGVVGAGPCLSGIHHIMSWKHESLVAASGEGIPLPNLFWAVYFPMGNAAMGFMVIFAMIAGVVGAGSCLSGIHHIMSWKHESLATASGEGIPLPNPFWAVYFPMGNAAMGFMVIFAMIAGVVGAGSCLSGIHHIMSWKHESLAVASGEGIPLPNPLWVVYFPMGKAAMGFMVIFAMIAGVVGAGSCLLGIHHIMSWKHESLAAASGAMTAWSLTLLAMGGALSSFLVPKLRDSMQAIMGCGVSSGWGQSYLGYLFGSDAPTTTNPVEKPPLVAAIA